ncbi:hypothetical protein [Methanobrevibacter woesei]|uniref:hypothetical protein n=1 Tax=Methanobrevibacter woesei TaxID=190976 RepID=UPI0039F58CD5
MNITQSYVNHSVQSKYPVKSDDYYNKFNSYKTLIKENIIKFKEYIQKKVNVFTDQYIVQVENKPSTRDIFNELINHFNNFGILLNRLENFEEECSDYWDIQNMSIYILRNDKLINVDNLLFIENMLSSFIDILECKNNEDYAEKYDNFSFMLIDYQQHFFTNIYTRSECYDEDSLSKITNLLLD